MEAHFFVLKTFKALPPSLVELYNTLSLATVTLIWAPAIVLSEGYRGMSGHSGLGKSLEN